MSTLHSARNSFLIWATSRSPSAAVLGASQSVAADSSASRRGSGKRPTIRTSSTEAPSTSSTSLTSTGIEVDVGEPHRELVDDDALVALEHVDADDVAAHGTDARRDESQCARSVREPDAYQHVC